MAVLLSGASIFAARQGSAPTAIMIATPAMNMLLVNLMALSYLTTTIRLVVWLSDVRIR